MLIPSALSVYGEYLPYGTDSTAADTILKKTSEALKVKGLLVPDVKKILSAAKEKDNLLYYRTDHHWTTDAAYEMYLYAEKKWKLNEKQEPEKEP